MDTVVYDSPADFMSLAQPLLERKEVANSLMLGVGLGIKEDPLLYGSPPFTCSVGDGDSPRLLALMTPPHPLQLISLGGGYADTVAAVAEALAAGDWQVPSVTATAPVAEAFARVWTARTGQAYRISFRMRVHELARVIEPEYSPGEFRAAKDDEQDLLADWFLRFDASVHEHPRIDAAEAEKGIRQRLDGGDAFVWCDGEPVTMALRMRPTVHTACIGGVYTPPELRKRGYATSCVARLSQVILDSGKRSSCLFTDLANPTSNKIYRGIGYRPVRDYVSVEIGDRG